MFITIHQRTYSKMEHKHLIMRCEVLDPPTSEAFIEQWLVELVEEIGMKVVAGPISSYVTKNGNEGLTAAVLIETSHIVIHIWDAMRPPLIQFDLYSCTDFSIEEVVKHFYEFIPQRMEYKFLDRNVELKVINEGRSNGGDRLETRLDNDGIQQYPF